MERMAFNLIQAVRNNYSGTVKNILEDNDININEMYDRINTVFSKVCFHENVNIIKLIVLYNPSKYSLSMGIKNITEYYNQMGDPYYDYPNFIICCNLLIDEANGDLDLIKPFFLQYFREDDIEIFKINFPNKYKEYKKLFNVNRFNL